MGTKWVTADVITFARMNQKTIIVQAAQPAIMYAGMLWLDTDDDMFYQRKAANDGWYTVTKEELAYTITGLWTFSRGANPPFACAAGSTQVANLIADDHAASHENAGGDEIGVAGLSGLLADDQHVLDAEVLLVAAALVHAARHKDGGADELDVSELAGAIGGAGEIPETDGAAVSWVEPDGRYDPKAHVLATTGPHTGTLPLTDLAVGVQGNIIIRGAVDWEALAVGAAGEALLTGGAAADPSWGAPAPAGHAASHADGAADEIDAADLAGTGGAAGEIIESDGDALSYVEPDGRYDPKAHAASHADGAADEIDVADLAGTGGAAGEIIESDGDALSYVEPDGRYAPASHENSHIKGGADDIDATLDGRAIAITTQGDIVHGSAANTITRLGAGSAGQTLKTGGAGANPSWTWNKELDPAPDATDTGNGITAKDVVGEIVIAGDVLYMKADGKYWKADASAAATMPAKVMAMAGGAADATVELLHLGYYREDSRWEWVLGNGQANLLFVHTTAGDIVQFANKPAGAGDQVQVVGWVIDANTIFFNPSLELVEVS